MKRLIPEFTFNGQQLNEIAALAQACALTEQTAQILYGRGVDTPEKVKRFLTAGKQHYLSPFLMSGMREAVELITRARDEDWVVAIYGDYDADGICAVTIMREALKRFGLKSFVFVPERKNGYGLSVEVLDGIFEEYNPQLIITVDCGISNAEEVRYVQEQGAEVIVTDHHELPDNIPDCICVNPKFNDSYPYDNLCGAGVAFKVGCALNGNSFYDMADVAAIATVADSVPLTGENRDIVTEGLKIINRNPRKCYAGFLTKNGESISAQTIAFSIAPKINAAGRMGDAESAVLLFSSENDRDIYDYTTKLSAYNIERQKHCDALYQSAKEQLKQKGVDGRVIMLWDESWNSGFVGIVAARLVEEYGRPCLLFVKNGNCLKGSARSIENVNIFEALKACSQYIEEFGGHSQAAGVNVLQENFDLLEKELNDYVESHYPESDFIPTVYVSGDTDGKLSLRVAKELEQLEPYGVGNKKPLFSMEVKSCSVRPLKALSQHVNVKYNQQEMLYFYGLKHGLLLESNIPKTLVFEYNLSNYHGKDYLKGLLRDVIYTPQSVALGQEQIKINNLLNATYPPTNCDITPISFDEAQRMISQEEVSTVYLANELSTLQRFGIIEKFGCEIFRFTTKQLHTVLLSPAVDVAFSGYRRIVWLDNPQLVTLSALQDCQVYVCNEIDGLSTLKQMNCDRQALLGIFRWLGANPTIEANDCMDALRTETPFDKTLFLFALKVFEELSLITYQNGFLTVCKGIKTDLTNSKLYNLINQKQ